VNLRKDHYRNIFFFEEMQQNTSHDRFQVPNGEGSTLSTLGSADDLSGRLSTRTGLRVGEPNATNNPSGSGRRSDALSGVFKAGWPAFIAPRIVLFLFFPLSMCGAFFSALEIHTNAIFRSCWSQHFRSGLVRRFCCQRRDSATNL